jgi:endonuclease/exonuclease/phosphatase family metal-dependent hydrolase
MRKSIPIVLAYAIIFLFFIHLAGTLVESVYILNLMNSSLNANALGVLFFFSPILLIPIHKRFLHGITWISFAILLITRGVLPYLKTAPQVIAAGIGIMTCIYLIYLLSQADLKGEKIRRPGPWGSAGLSLAILLSVFLRTIEFGLDYSLTRGGGWTGWILGLILGWSLMQLEFEAPLARQENSKNGATSAFIGIILILTLVWFSFSAPSVIARWTQGNYTLIVTGISLVALTWVAISLIRPGFVNRISPLQLRLWNIGFVISLGATILVHRVNFPPTPDSAAVIVRTPLWINHIPLYLTILLLPILFIDLNIFINQIRKASPAPKQMLSGFLLAGLLMTVLVFAHIFTNVWGYVKPISQVFRNMFWLPYTAMTVMITILMWRTDDQEYKSQTPQVQGLGWGLSTVLALLFIGSLVRALPPGNIPAGYTKPDSLVVMTFNTQQSNDDVAEKSYDRQMELIRFVNPDILALQESDSTRIGLNNNDYVRYFGGKLGYYSYYGPSTVTGTYGTAILSRFPLENTRTVFTYSDKDEIGTAEAEIVVNGVRFTIIDVHPDGSDTAMLAFAQALMDRTRGVPHVIALGDFNLRDYEDAYLLIDQVFTNSWTSVYPLKISPDGIDMSGENRIDHIFLSPDLFARNPVYVLPPESATDHPVHWTQVFWEE